MNADENQTDELEDLCKQYQACFSTPAGQAVLDDLDRVHLNRSCTKKNLGEYYLPHEIQIRASEQEVPMRIHRLIELADQLAQDRLQKKMKKPEPPDESEDDDA